MSGDAADEAEEAVEDGEGVRGAARDVEVDRKEAFGAAVDFVVFDEGSASYGAGTDGDDDFRRRNGVVGVHQGGVHVLGDGAGEEDSIGVAGCGDELDAEASEVPTDGSKHVDVGFAGVASSGTDLAEFEGAPE